MEGNAESIDWGSSAALCPFCGASQCSGSCLCSPAGVLTLAENSNTSLVKDSIESQTPPCLTEAVAEMEELLDDEDDNDELLYTISKTFTMTENSDQDAEATKLQLEALMMHHLHYSQPMNDRGGTTSTQTSCNVPIFISHDNGQLALPVREETDSEVKSRDMGGSLSHLASCKHSAASLVRSIVSQSKRRYHNEGFDLDLTYITPRIIAMGFPAWGAERFYRNPIDDVELFFESKYAGHYRIYNLCAERLEYDSPKRFQGKFKRFPFVDHSAPCPITLISDFVRDAMAFLEEDEKNIVAVHCKAGKGRTGIMVSCLLRSLDPLCITSAEEALRFYGEARTYNGKGVTIPSQIRYVHYYDQVVKEFDGKFPPSRSLKLYQIVIDSDIKVSGNVDLYFVIEERGVEKIDSRYIFPQGPVKDSKGCLFIFPDEPVLEGDLRFVFFQRKRLVDERLFHFWINTSLCSAHEHLSYANRQLDGRLCKMEEEVFCKELAIHVLFVDCIKSNGTEDSGEYTKKEGSGCVAPRKNDLAAANFLQKALQRFSSKLPLVSKGSQDSDPQ